MFIEPYIYDMGLDQLTQVGENWNFRCISCGDSKKSATKRRGWFKLSKNNVYYACCYNCGLYAPFIIFLRNFFPPLYTKYKKDHIEEIRNYRKQRLSNASTNLNQISNFNPSKIKELEILTEETEDNTINVKLFRELFENFVNTDFTISKTKNTVIALSKIDKSHYSYNYMSSRLLPINLFNDLYYTKSFMHFCNCICPETFKINPRFDERIIIPFRNINGELIGMQGRSLDPDTQMRYLTWIFDKEHPQLFGLNKVNINKPIWIVEGPIDSMFIPNCLAIGGSDFDSSELVQFSKKENFIFMYDPENRNYELIKTIEKRINEGFKVCILPESIRKYGKDINDFIKNGLSINEIMKIANENIFSGLQAKIHLNIWRKIYK